MIFDWASDVPKRCSRRGVAARSSWCRSWVTCGMVGAFVMNASYECLQSNGQSENGGVPKSEVMTLGRLPFRTVCVFTFSV